MKFTKHLMDILTNQYDLDMRSDYSGRFMYGRICIAISCESVDSIHRFYRAMHQLAQSVEQGDDEFQLEEADKNFIDFFLENDDITICWDQLGLGMIVYFPQIMLEN